MDKEIIYTATNGKKHKIQFYDLLEKGHNMDKHILNGSLLHRPDHDFRILKSLLSPESVVYDVGSYIGIVVWISAIKRKIRLNTIAWMTISKTIKFQTQI